MENPTGQFVSAIVRSGADILMVRHQSPPEPQPYWSLPGGRVEAGETPRQALVREVKEESGLTVLSIGSLVYRTEMLIEQEQRFGVADVFDVTAWTGDIVVRDPDNKVLQAAFIPLEQALVELAKINYRPMSEPPIAYLNGNSRAGTVYRYRVGPNGTAELLETHGR